MSNFLPLSKDGTTLKTVYVLPSQCEWSDIEQLQGHNRGANEPKERLDELMKAVKAREGFVTALKGYVEKQTIMITAGSRRLAVGQALESEGDVFKLPVLLIAKPKTDEQIIDALLDGDADNNQRNGDSDVTRHNTYSILQEMGLTLVQIGERTGVSHTQVANTIKVFRVEPLAEAIAKGKLTVSAATPYVGEKYQKVDANNKVVTEIIVNDDGKKVRRPLYDLDRIKKDLGGAIQTATEAGKGKVGRTTVNQSAREQKDEATGMKMVRIILDEPEDDVPTVFRIFCRLLDSDKSGLTLSSFKTAIKKNKLEDELGWLLDVEFNIKKRVIAKDKEEQAKKAKGKKAAPTGRAKKEDEEEISSEDYE